jgi:formate dehydrogenase beta subunit
MAASNGDVGMRVQARPPGTEARAGKFPGPTLMPELTAIQRDHGWLPREKLTELSREHDRPLYEIEGLISFYPHFRTEPPSKVDLHVCHDLSCWLHGSDERIAEIRARYGDDVEIEIQEVSCLGRCDLAPAVAIDERAAPAAEAVQLVEAARQDGLAPAKAHRGDAPRANDPYAPGEEHYRVLRRALAGELDRDDIIAALKDSELRGLGGAGFPTGSKWELVRQQDNTPKYAICNADESEPAAFKDRQIMAEQPHLVLEGLLLGMLVTGSEEGWIFIRHEYGPEEEVLREEVASLRAAGLLSEDALGSGVRLELDIFTSPGGYILGEETALLECMEGHRGEPRNKPPFPGVYGLWGQPTLMNSVETFADVPVIVERGAEWWKAQGVNGAGGLKFFAVSGHVMRPGVYCLPMGTTLGELVTQAGGVRGGAKLLAVQPGGASSNFLGPERLDVPLDFQPLLDAGSMLGAGGVVVVAEGTDLVAAATNVLRFFRNESCGKCVPCRVGSHKALLLLTDVLARGEGPEAVADELELIEEAARMTSICGLGQVALGPVMSVLRMRTEGQEGEQAEEAGAARTHDA